MKKVIVLLLAAVLLFVCASALADSVRIKEGSNPNVRNKPSKENSTVVGNAKSGQVYELLDQKDNWYKIRLTDGTEGWIASGMASIVKTDQAAASGAKTAAPKPTATPKPTEAPKNQPTVPPTIRIAEVQASIAATDTWLEESYSQPVLDANGLHGFVSNVYIGRGNEKGSVLVLCIGFKNSNEDIPRFYPAVSNLKVDGIAYEMNDNSSMAVSGKNKTEEMTFSGRPIEGNIPDLKTIKTIEFSLTLKDGIASMYPDQPPYYDPSYEKWYGVTYVIEDHVTVTVNPQMEKGQAVGASFTAKGRAINADGSVAFEYGAAYDRVVSSHGGLVFVERCLNKEDSLYGIVDLTGREIVPVEMEGFYFGAFPDGLIPAKKDGKWGYMDPQGNFVIEPQYDYYRPFSEGVAPVFIGTVNVKGSPEQGSYYLIDRDNKVLADLGAWDYVYAVSEGRARVRKDGRWGMIDLEGNVVIEPVYDSVGDMTNGRAFVKQDGKYSLADENGQLLCDFVLEQASYFSAEGYSLLKENGKYRLVNAQLETVADLSAYTYVEWYRTQNIAFCYDGELDGNGNPSRKDYYTPFTVHLLDGSGKEIMTVETDNLYELKYFPGQGVIYRQCSLEARDAGMTDLAGNTLIPFQYDAIYTTELDDVFITYQMDFDYVNRAVTRTYSLYSLKDGEYAQIDFDPQVYEDDFYSVDLKDGLMFLNPIMIEE